MCGSAPTSRGTARHHLPEIEALGATTEPEGEYDVILELVGGGENLAANVDRLAPKGRIAVIGTGAGSKAEIDFGLLMRKRGRISSSTLRPRSRDEKEDVLKRLEGHALPLLARGELMVPVEVIYPLERAQEAYDRFAAGGKFGKIVIVP